MPRPRIAALALAAACQVAGCSTGGGDEGHPGYRVDGEGISAPLDGLTGDAGRGRARILARDPANCILCHAVPEATLSGNLGPSLAGAGRRFTAAELRLRVVDERRVVPQTIMPSYYRTAGLTGVAPEYRGRTILDAQAIEDIVAYLGTLR